MIKKKLVFVVYDSILNPVFQGQVLQILLSKLKKNPDLKIYLISFEKDNIPTNKINDIIPKVENLEFFKFKRFPVIGKFTLWHSVFILRKFLKQLNDYDIICRGPLTGWVSLKSINFNSCISFKVQARGLIGQEYTMIYSGTNKFKKIIAELRKKIFEKIEKEIYNPKKIPENFCIESISQALTNYLTQNFAAKNEYIKIAIDDIPSQIINEQKKIWREHIRDQLKISKNMHIYCYNGSCKPWQDIDLTIIFFKQKLLTEKNIFLLVLTQEKTEFEKILKKYQIDELYYKILYVHHNEIYKYLCACDTGLIFRKEHIANWISRPIKAMEYNAVGLKIIHNNTVKWLIDNK